MAGPLDMANHIDDVFASQPVTLQAFTEGRRDEYGIWVPGEPIEEVYTANIQPLNDRETDNLLRAGKRVVDPRKLYINSGNLELLKLAQDLEFLGQTWQIIASDIRPWRTYAKIVVSRYDDQ